MVIKEADFIDSKPVQVYAWDGSNPVRIGADANGNISASLISSLVNVAHDAKLLTWTTGKLTSIKYYVGGLAGTLVLTITLGYDVDGNLASMVRS